MLLNEYHLYLSLTFLLNNLSYSNMCTKHLTISLGYLVFFNFKFNIDKGLKVYVLVPFLLREIQ